jgi:hypothetical protein
MAPGTRIVTDFPESDSGDDMISEALGSVQLDVDSTRKPWWSMTPANAVL